MARARGFGLAPRSYEWDNGKTRSAEFTVRAFNPRWPRDLLFLHLEKGLVGVARPPKENGGAVTVRLGPGAAVTGRLVDSGGKPRAGVELGVRFRPRGKSVCFEQFGYFPESVKTDREGRFRIEALLPGYEFRLSDGQGELPVGAGLRAGQAKDLGDVRMKSGSG